MMNLTQTKIVGLTMELDLKTREYQMLCNAFKSLKDTNIDANDKKFYNLRKAFLQNNYEIKVNFFFPSYKSSFRFSSIS